MIFNYKTVTRGRGLLENFLSYKRTSIANKLIKKNKTNRVAILDIGCGEIPYFLLQNNFQKKYGVDPNIKEKLDGINVKKINVEKEKLPFKNSSFDSVLMLAVYEHINKNKIEFVLKEIKRVLKKDGLFIMTTPAPWGHLLLTILSEVKIVSKEEIKDHKHKMSNTEIKKYLKKIGFNRVKSGFFECFLNMWFTGRG